jgi:hypothetical protein
VHRPRGGTALSDTERPIPQAWVPRVTNGALALVLIVLMSPIVITWDDRTNVQRVFLTGMALFFGIFVVLCGIAALKPGALGRFAQRGRAKRLAKKAAAPEA